MISTNDSHNPMSEYLLKLQLIVNNCEFKNKTEADNYETLETKLQGEAYVRAVNKTDVFESYKYDDKDVYNRLSDLGYNEEQIFFLIKNPYMLPQSIKNDLLEEQREYLIATYVERNQYYIRLTGKPFGGNNETPAETILVIPDEFYQLYASDNVIERHQPVHEMPIKYQDLFMNSTYYTKMVVENPQSKYLKYIGSNSIPIHISRKGKDGDILKINTNKLSTHHIKFGDINVDPNTIHMFVMVYNETRDYVYYTLRGDFSSIYENYDSFIRFLTIYLSIGNTINELTRKSSSMIYMNNTTANNFFMLYGLPSVIMEGKSMIDFLKKFRMILMDKGTNTVYRVKDLIGYEYTDIYTLVMVKQQVFEKGIPVYTYDENGVRSPKHNIVFRRFGTSADNTSYFKFKNNDVSYTVDEVTGGDPRWWNTPEVEEMLSSMNYTLSNSKYIQLSTHLSMTDIWWQCVILLRGLLDRKQETQFISMNINCNINGIMNISVFEAVLVLTILMNWHLVDTNGKTMRGEMYNVNGFYNGKEACLDLLFNGLNEDGSPKNLITGQPYMLSSFNFKLRNRDPAFYKYISTIDYLKPDTLIPMLDKIFDMESNNIGEILMTDVKNVYDYLETKLRLTKTVSEFRDTTDVFNKLFLVDPVQNNWSDGISDNTDTILMNEYDITMSELTALKNFFNKDEPDLVITYKNKTFDLYMYDIMNMNVLNILINDEYPFKEDEFVKLFMEAMASYVSNELLTSSIYTSIKNNYKSIIIDKVTLDVGGSEQGLKTFESLLFRQNSALYRNLMLIKNDSDEVLTLLRTLVKALESYTNSSLSALEFKVVGVETYFNILKEVISYFKSYMIEFTRDEFVFLFDGLFDNGGNSDMLKLFDEVSTIEVDIKKKDSLNLYDVSTATVEAKMCDNIQMYDEAVFQIYGTYQSMLDSGYKIMYDDGVRLSSEPITIDPLTKLTAGLTYDEAGNILLIININNLDIIPPNYVGNVRPN